MILTARIHKVLTHVYDNIFDLVSCLVSDGDLLVDDEIQPSTSSSTNERTRLGQRIRKFFVKYSGEGDGETWLLQMLRQFQRQDFSRSDRYQAIPFLLEDSAYLWYVQNERVIINFESFSKLFLRQFSIKSNSVEEINPSLTSSLSMTMAREIIKSPSYFRDSRDDVIEWLEKLEQRFKMAN